MNSLDDLRAAVRPFTSTPEHTEGVIDLFRYLLSDGTVMGLKELRIRLGIKPSAMNMRTYRHAAPDPAGRIGNGRLWFAPDVEEWIAENPRAVRHHEVEQEAS